MSQGVPISMGEHAIRLRAAWELHREGSPPARFDLPDRGPAPRGVALRLVRGFQRPRIDPAVESLWLVLGRTPGLTGVLLNGQDLLMDRATCGDRLELPLPGSLPSRCRLELLVEVDPVSWTAAAHEGGWGEVALVIRELDARGSPSRLTGPGGPSPPMRDP